MLSTSDGKGVLLVGGFNAASYIFEYRTKWYGEDEWKNANDKFYQLNNFMKFGRYYPVAVLIHDKYVKCGK